MIDAPEGPFAFAGLLILLILLVVLAIFDKTHNGSVLRVTVLGRCGLLSILILLGFVVSGTAFGRAFVLALT